MISIFNDETDIRQLTQELNQINKRSDAALELARAGHWRLAPGKNGDFIVSKRARDILGDSPNPIRTVRSAGYSLDLEG